jgi:hypothetical protein
MSCRPALTRFIEGKVPPALPVEGVTLTPSIAGGLMQHIAKKLILQ